MITSFVLFPGSAAGLRRLFLVTRHLKQINSFIHFLYPLDSKLKVTGVSWVASQPGLPQWIMGLGNEAPVATPPISEVTGGNVGSVTSTLNCSILF